MIEEKYNYQEKKNCKYNKSENKCDNLVNTIIKRNIARRRLSFFSGIYRVDHLTERNLGLELTLRGFAGGAMNSAYISMKNLSTMSR